MQRIDIKLVDNKTRRKVDHARSRLVLQQPFFGVLLLQADYIYTTDVPTFATDSTCIYINPIFASTLTTDEIEGVLIHEVMHKIYMHLIRRNGRDPKRFNAAADYAINPMIKADGFVLPEGGLDDPKYHNMTAEDIYDKLPKDTELPPGWEDIIDDDNLSEAERSQLEQKTKIDVAKAISTAGDDIPDHIKRMITEILETKVDWRTKLRDFIMISLGDEDTTWKRPNRNYLHDDLYIPSLQGRAMPQVCIMLDTSGSIYCQQELFEEFTSEVNKIIEDLVPERVDIFYVDTRIRKHDTFEEGEIPEYELVGGGGTDFTTAWPKMEATDPACIIAFTDLWASLPDHSSVPTLWATYENTDPKVPFGEIIMVK